MPTIVKVGVCNLSSRLLKEFSVVEIQQTFYNMPRESTVNGWREKAGKDFTFSFKVFQGITHTAKSPTWRKYRGEMDEKFKEQVGDLKLNNFTKSFWEKMLKYSELLEAKFMVIQTPPSFSPKEENIKNLEKTYEFLEKAIKDKDVYLAWEPRGKWLDEKAVTKEIVEGKNKLIHVTDPFFEKPTVIKEVAYFRLHGVPFLNYKYVYTNDDYQKLVRIIEEIENEGAKEIYVMFNNVRMVDNAKEFKTFLQEVSSWKVF